MGDSRVYLGVRRESVERQMLAILANASIFCMKKSAERVAGSGVGFERGVIEN